VSKTALQKKIPAPLREKGQFLLGFSVVAAMLYLSGFPLFVIFFLSALSYFIWKMFSSASRVETRRIFEFYLSANQILREDERRWYGFEIKETIAKGERILQSMNVAPPLLHFALGALQHKIGDHAGAVKNLSAVVEKSLTQELLIVFPTPELREYVKLLRKVEREPADAPQTSAAIRALERARKNAGKKLLEDSRAALDVAQIKQIEDSDRRPDSFREMMKDDAENGTPSEFPQEAFDEPAHDNKYRFIDIPLDRKPVKHDPSAPYSDRKSISEVLHDIYDKNVQ